MNEHHTTAHTTQQSIDDNPSGSGVSTPPILGSEEYLLANSTAARVTLEKLLSTIISEHYFTAADGVDGAYLNRKRIEDPTSPVTLIPLDEDAEITGTPMGDLALLTFCVLRLENGFTVHGSSACADPANYDETIGRHYAREDAIKKIWPLLGYELKTQLYFDKILAATFDEF